MDIEKLATAALKTSISQTGRLADFVNDGDKEPSWDGNLYIYANEKKSKEGIKKIPVQVKGKKVRKFPPKKNPKFSVSIVDLDNWLRDGGVILFVVLLDETGKQNVIYFKGLTPVFIQNLKEHNQGRKSISISLKAFPEDNDGKVGTLLNFYDHMKKQTSYANAHLLTVEELANKGVLESVTMTVTTFGKKGENDPISAFLTDDVYSYANIKGSPIPQPLPEIPIDICVSTELKGEVCTSKKTFYSEYKVTRTKDSYSIDIGKSISLNFNKSESNGRLTFKPSGTLSEYINDIECMISLLESGSLSINGTTLHFSNIDKCKIEEFQNNLNYYKDIKKMLDLLGVKKELEVTGLSEQDKINLRNFTNAIVYDQLIVFPGLFDNVIYGTFKLGNLNIGIWADKEGEAYRLDSFFSDKRTVLLERTNTEPSVPHTISHYVLLRKQDFLEIDNIDYEKIEKDIIKNESSPIVEEQIILLMLEILKAYDAQNNKEERLLDLADKYCSWLESLSNFDPIKMELNRLQIEKRKRNLIDSEIVRLYEINNSTSDVMDRCGANLLLERREVAQECFDKMTPEEKKTFIEFPICTFGNLEYKKE